MFTRHRDDAEFLLVYIREAHPSDSNWADLTFPIADPKTLEERNAVATRCRTKLSLSLPAVVDDLDDAVNQRYHAWPERIYVIGRDGKIAYKGAIGPFGFKPDEAEKALEALLRAK